MPTRTQKPVKQGGPRSAARLAVVQAFYQLLMADEPNSDKVAAEYMEHRLGAELEGDQYVAATLSYSKTFSQVLGDAEMNGVS